MKAASILFAAMTFGATFALGGAAHATSVCNAPSGLNLRSYPSLHAPVTRTLADGSELGNARGTSPNGLWTKVSVNGRNGWVYSAYTCAADGTSSASNHARHAAHNGGGSSGGSGNGPGDAAASAVASSGNWRSPVPGTCVTSPYGRRSLNGRGEFHPGLDLGVPCGTPVHPTAPGKVIFAGWKGGYGNAVMIQHPNGLVTLYGHNSHLDVRPGQQVDQGTVISKSGSTGRSTGCHVHFEVRNGPNGSTRDPRTLIGFAHCPTEGGPIDDHAGIHH